MNLNAWLHQTAPGVERRQKRSGDWFEDVDWSRTPRLHDGLNGLYLNMKGRSGEGIRRSRRESGGSKRKELRTSWTGWSIRPRAESGHHRNFDCDALYGRPYVDNAPDLIVGYGEGFRASWDSVMGKVTSAIFEDISRPGAGITAWTACSRAFVFEPQDCDPRAGHCPM